MAMGMEDWGRMAVSIVQGMFAVCLGLAVYLCRCGCVQGDMQIVKHEASQWVYV